MPAHSPQISGCEPAVKIPPVSGYSRVAESLPSWASCIDLERDTRTPSVEAPKEAESAPDELDCSGAAMALPARIIPSA